VARAGERLVCDADRARESRGGRRREEETVRLAEPLTEGRDAGKGRRRPSASENVPHEREQSGRGRTTTAIRSGGGSSPQSGAAAASVGGGKGEAEEERHDGGREPWQPRATAR